MNDKPTTKHYALASIGPALGCAAGVVYMIVGAIQVFATVRGIALTLHLPSFINWFIAFVIAWIPILGTLAGIKGAMVGWGWPLWKALAFFGGPYVLYLIAIVCGGLADLWARHKGAPG